MIELVVLSLNFQMNYLIIKFQVKSIDENFFNKPAPTLN